MLARASRCRPLLLEAVAWAESRFNTAARSPTGAIGVMQLMPGTAAELGVDPTDATANIHGGARYLRQMLVLFDGDIERALAAYNAGPAAVQRYNGTGSTSVAANFSAFTPTVASDIDVNNLGNYLYTPFFPQSQCTASGTSIVCN